MQEKVKEVLQDIIRLKKGKPLESKHVPNKFFQKKEYEGTGMSSEEEEPESQETIMSEESEEYCSPLPKRKKYMSLKKYKKIHKYEKKPRLIPRTLHKEYGGWEGGVRVKSKWHTFLKKYFDDHWQTIPGLTKEERKVHFKEFVQSASDAYHQTPGSHTVYKKRKKQITSSGGGGYGKRRYKEYICSSSDEEMFD